MSDEDGSSGPGHRLPEVLTDRLDALDLPELRAVLSYVEARIESLRTPLEEEITNNSAGEILDIENHGGYALVRMHPPAPDGSTVDTGLVSLYHVRREQQVSGEESLHWAYLGDVDSAGQDRCRSCGHPVDGDATVCPYCGSENPGSEGGT